MAQIKRQEVHERRTAAAMHMCDLTALRTMAMQLCPDGDASESSGVPQSSGSSDSSGASGNSGPPLRPQLPPAEEERGRVTGGESAAEAAAGADVRPRNAQLQAAAEAAPVAGAAQQVAPNHHGVPNNHVMSTPAYLGP